MKPKKLYIYHSAPRQLIGGAVEWIYISGRKIRLNQDGTVSQNSIWYSVLMEIEKARRYGLKVPRVGAIEEITVPQELWTKIKDERYED